MKKLVLVALLLTAMIHGSMANPKNPHKESAQLSVTSSPLHQQKALIKIDNLIEGKKAFLKIKDEKGRLLHAETIHKGKSFTRSYDFSDLGAGAYIVEVRNQAGTTTEKFVIQEEKQDVYFKPVVKVESDMIRVVFQNPLKEAVSVKLYDQNGHVVYKSTVNSQEIFAQGLDTSRLRNKQFSLSIKNLNYQYSQNINAK